MTNHPAHAFASRRLSGTSPPEPSASGASAAVSVIGMGPYPQRRFQLDQDVRRVCDCLPSVTSSLSTFAWSLCQLTSRRSVSEEIGATARSTCLSPLVASLAVLFATRQCAGSKRTSSGRLGTRRVRCFDEWVIARTCLEYPRCSQASALKRRLELRQASCGHWFRTQIALMGIHPCFLVA